MNGEFWIEMGELSTWNDATRRIQRKIIADKVVDADWNSGAQKWIIVKEDGRVFSLGRLNIPEMEWSRNGARARWNGMGVLVQERDGSTKWFDERGFLIRVQKG